MPRLFSYFQTIVCFPVFGFVLPFHALRGKKQAIYILIPPRIGAARMFLLFVRVAVFVKSFFDLLRVIFLRLYAILN